MRLKHQVVLITGAARGIGESIVRLFVKEGATVIITDILDKVGQSLAAELGKQTHYLHLDVSQEAQWASTADFIKAEFGHLDVLVNNAGIIGFESGERHDPEHASYAAWQHVHRVNLDSVFFGCRMAIGLMKEHGGSIINMSSRSGLVGMPAAAAYASSKAAIGNHTKTVALYCAEQGYSIRCNSLHPAAILTPLWDTMLGTGASRQQRIDEISRTIPLRTMGEPIDVAYAALFLASNESKYMTGSQINLDGGILAGSAASVQHRV